jgi:hypothetical protein
MDRGLEAARAVSRDAIFRVTLLSASIVGFSATLLSIEQIDLQADRTLLAVSWCLFAAVVVVGPMSVALEARAKYIVEWRSIQPQDFDSSKRRLTMTERIKLLGVLAYSVSIRPRSLFFARDTDYSRDKPTQGMKDELFLIVPHAGWQDACASFFAEWGDHPAYGDEFRSMPAVVIG